MTLPMPFLYDLPPLPAAVPAPAAKPVALKGAERRSHVRREVDYAAIVRTPNHGDVAARVRDVSAMGASVELRPGTNVADTFRLIIPAEMFSADCEVRHRTDGRIGVLFTSNRLEAMSRFG